tara:strand:+ start:218 stop:1513 length:1296 start_codon:yes stop_codon:yes gene_type:complete
MKLLTNNRVIIIFVFLTTLFPILRFYSGNFELYDFGVFNSNLYSLNQNILNFFQFDSFRLTILPLSLFLNIFEEYNPTFLFFLNSIIFSIPFFFVKKNNYILFLFIFFSYPIWFQIIHGLNVDSIGYILVFFIYKAYKENQRNIFFFLILLLSLTKEYYLYISIAFIFLYYLKYKNLNNYILIFIIIFFTFYFYWFIKFDFFNLYIEKSSFAQIKIFSNLLSLILFYFIFVVFIDFKYQAIIYFPLLFLFFFQDIDLSYRYLNSHYVIPLIGLTHSFLVFNFKLDSLINHYKKMLLIFMICLTPIIFSPFFWTNIFTTNYHYSNYILDFEHFNDKRNITKSIPTNSILAIQNSSVDFFSFNRNVLLQYSQIQNNALINKINNQFKLKDIYVLVDRNKYISKSENEKLNSLINSSVIKLLIEKNNIFLYAKN